MNPWRKERRNETKRLRWEGFQEKEGFKRGVKEKSDEVGRADRWQKLPHQQNVCFDAACSLILSQGSMKMRSVPSEFDTAANIVSYWYFENEMIIGH